ncbi:MAG: hypothetical protein HETSPECPRED_003700 [Heterodermia speciosa]|uniref:Uncharacterized protein n=1 Tax=Heterodermia speciosa TaxID=116794 RepID=A0A8H3F582_9LECA|nr:MAG: hypothetical protein HETSPECPRED_003700 [Heterodermia speciosa]
MNQTHYLTEVLNELGMKTERHKITNISMNGYDFIKFPDSSNERINAKNYQHVVEKIIQFLNDSTKQHDEDLKHLLRYLRSTINLGLMLGDNESFKIIEYSDSDYAADKSDRKCILKYVYMLKEAPIA